MSSSNLASINNLHCGINDSCPEIHDLCYKKDNLEEYMRLVKFTKYENVSNDTLLKNIEEKLIIARKIWYKKLDTYEEIHEEFYDEKFKENTRRRKGKNNQLKFLEKAEHRLVKLWEKEKIGADLYVSKKTHKSELLPDYKQNNYKNYRKLSRQQVRQQASKV
jgi:hypothetical protein